MNTAGQADKGPHITGPSKTRSAAKDYSNVAGANKPNQIGTGVAAKATQKVNYGQSTHK